MSDQPAFQPPSDPHNPIPPPPPPPSGLMPPPGYTEFHNNPVPPSVKRVGGLAMAVVILTGIVALGTIATVLLSAGVSSDATKFLDGQLTDDEFQSAIGPLNGIQALTGIATLAAGILTIIWMFRTAKNVRAFGRQTTWSPLFAIFGWALPPMILYIIPFLMFRELWRASDPTVNNSDDWKRSGENTVLWFWFALFGLLPTVLLALQVGSLSSSGIPSGSLNSVAESLEDFGALTIATGIVSVLAAVVWVMFVRQLTDRHTKLTGET